MIGSRVALLAAMLGLVGNTHSAEPAAALRPAPPKPRLVAFIGEQVSYEKLPCDPRHAERNGEVDEFGCAPDDYAYLGRYRIVEPLSGEVSGVVEFESAGFMLDEIAASRWAVLYVGIAPTRTWLVSELSAAVYPTTSGSWATCDTDYSYGKDLLGPVLLAGDPSFGDVRWMSARGAATRFPPETYAIVDGRARCRRGLELPELMEALEAKLAAYGGNNGWIDEENAPPDP